MPKVSGTVYRYGSDRRIEHASVKATKGSQIQYMTTDDDGDFTFEDLEPGKWTLTALHDSSFPSKVLELDLMENT
ncbi:MAG: carboxypeptidase-like regulatory domain-containing protein, partial [Anaerolineae bacterium]|nr:carboxypeptidase-like regulatory domain-containing protein [Anaerolineae bacterium]